MMFSPDASRIVVVLSGYREQGAVIVDRASRSLVQRLIQPAAFLGAAFAPDGRFLYVSGGDRDVVYRYAWRADSAALVDCLAIGPVPWRDFGRAYPAGLACSPDGVRLYVAENLGDSLAVVDLATRRVTTAPGDRTLSLWRRGGRGGQGLRLGLGRLVDRHVRAAVGRARSRSAHRGGAPPFHAPARRLAPAPLRDVRVERSDRGRRHALRFGDRGAPRIRLPARRTRAARRTGSPCHPMAATSTSPRPTTTRARRVRARFAHERRRERHGARLVARAHSGRVVPDGGAGAR